MKDLSLRLRVFLFFCLIAIGSLAITALALWVGFRQLDDPAAVSAFTTSGIIAMLGITGLTALIWLLFDDNVSKAVERIAASLRVRAHVDMSTPLDVSHAKYLGDLGPAASAMSSVLNDLMQSRTEKIKDELAQLTVQRDQLIEILSDIPVATILATADHQIILYDGQAAALMNRVAPALLKSSVFAYFDEAPILDALEHLETSQASRTEITVTSRCDRIYAGYIRKFGEGAGYTLMLEPLEPAAARPLVFDFELLTPKISASLRDSPLNDLVYVVFDTETTGLDPSTDEVVQLAAVRVVNGKLVEGEALDTLVNPTIDIPQRSSKVHGITNDIVVNAPKFGDVCTKFHGFASASVLVAHNAAFDMAFLHKQARMQGPVFDHPVIDTVLLSAAVFGGSAVHTLDAICERLSIEIPADKRHTAMGDSLATAKAFVAMIRILKERGIETFGALQVETEQHRRVLRA